jgi:hypothetical protein
VRFAFGRVLLFTLAAAAFAFAGRFTFAGRFAFAGRLAFAFALAFALSFRFRGRRGLLSFAFAGEFVLRFSLESSAGVTVSGDSPSLAGRPLQLLRRAAIETALCRDSLGYWAGTPARES